MTIGLRAEYPGFEVSRIGVSPTTILLTLRVLTAILRFSSMARAAQQPAASAPAAEAWPILWSSMNEKQLVNYITGAVERFASGVLTYEQIRYQVTDIITSYRLRHPIMPLPGEITGVSRLRPKTAALLFDRIWMPGPWVPQSFKDVAVYGATDLEIIGCVLSKFLLQNSLPPAIFANWGASLNIGARGREDSEKVLVAALGLKSIAAVPVYASKDNFERDYRPGDYSVMLGVIDHLKIVDEKRLSWEQVDEFRHDVKAHKHYRSLVHWLDSEMVGKSESYIADELSARIDRYQTALAKHGVLTVVGALESMLDPKFVAGAGALFGVVSLAATPLAGAAAVTALTVGSASCKIARSLLDRADVKNSATEVAFIYDLRSAQNAG